MKYPEKVKEHIIEWLKKYISEANQNGFIVGVSGGVDSAVTSTLCALTEFPVYAIEMSIHQNKNQISRAKEHLKWLKKNYKNVKIISHSLTNVFESFKGELIKQNKHNLDLLSLANTRARLRMITLYYFAGYYKSLVVGTGNKVEDFGIGFYTKHGDGAVDLCPIADLLKSDVYSLASHLKIISSIQKAIPADGLWDDNRTDEEQIGAKYSSIEEAMNLISNNVPIENLTKKQAATRMIYLKLNNKNQHKMLPIPICKIPKKIL